MRSQSVDHTLLCLVPLIYPFLLSDTLQGVSLGIADGVGGWVDAGVDPSLFSQALMYHAHRYAKSGWPGEPEIDPTQEYEEREKVEGWELKPTQCLELAYDAVLRERFVPAGECNLSLARISLLNALLLGSSTACIVNLNAYSGELRSAKYVYLTFVLY